MIEPNDTFIVKGVGCWCPDKRTLQQARISGHTRECTKARRAWEMNYRHLSAIARERRVNEEIGRQVRYGSKK